MVKLATRALLEHLGLTITTPKSNTRGYGYNWGGRLWVGPFENEYQALKAAFDEALEIMKSERPYNQSDDGAWWLWHHGWQYLGKLEHVKESNQP
jgi:hypothetical protein